MSSAETRGAENVTKKVSMNAARSQVFVVQVHYGDDFNDVTAATANGTRYITLL